VTRLISNCSSHVASNGPCRAEELQSSLRSTTQSRKPSIKSSVHQRPCIMPVMSGCRAAPLRCSIRTIRQGRATLSAGICPVHLPPWSCTGYIDGIRAHLVMRPAICCGHAGAAAASYPATSWVQYETSCSACAALKQACCWVAAPGACGTGPVPPSQAPCHHFNLLTPITAALIAQNPVGATCRMHALSVGRPPLGAPASNSHWQLLQVQWL
jgi:hypothetical protein